MRGVREAGLPIVEIEAPRLTKQDLALAHEPWYVEMIESLCAGGGGALDMDTYASSGTWEAALTSAGGVRAVVEALRETTDATGFVAARPPGHHALREKAMGLCFFNNVAIEAMRLSAEGEKVAILDWDVHHGNGTQALIQTDPNILYVSVHQSPFYPFEGVMDDIRLDAAGTTLNIPLPAGTGGDVIRPAWGEVVMPVMSQFAPDWVLVSAGFDGHVADPLAEFRMTTQDYGWIAAQIAHNHSPNRVVVVLEGGYDLDALRDSARETLQCLSGRSPGDETLGSILDARPLLDEAKEDFAEFWAL